MTKINKGENTMKLYNDQETKSLYEAGLGRSRSDWLSLA
ncbi:hypothetical protein BSPWISOX_2935 [uncultured Gammaproteobacteria bacterium]|jgi:hypothetical protein|nr:hypothetical protein BSPWISOX_2935 [uncultured Gammaproteobacteria bacterium]